MAAIDATAGGASANSYATIAQADTYHELHTDSTWSNLSVAEKTSALQLATRLLDEMMLWSGAPKTTTQALRVPRAGLVDRDGQSITDTAIPQSVINGVSELARLANASDITASQSQDVEGLRSLKAGPVELHFKDGESGPSSFDLQTIPQSVRLLIPPSVGIVRRTGARKLVRN